MSAKRIDQALTLVAEMGRMVRTGRQHTAQYEQARRTLDDLVGAYRHSAHGLKFRLPAVVRTAMQREGVQ